MGDLRKSDLHPGRKKRYAAHQHSIRGPNRAGFESGSGFEARNRFAVRPGLCACHGIVQFIPGEYRSACLGVARQKCARPHGPGSQRKQ